MISLVQKRIAFTWRKTNQFFWINHLKITR